MTKLPVYYKNGESASPKKCSKCGKDSWCLWATQNHGFLCYECICNIRLQEEIKNGT